MPSSEHLLVFDDRAVAEAVADGLDPHTYSVRVLRDALAGEDDAEDAQWLVHVAPVVDDRETTPGAVEAERARLASLATDNGGWYDPVE